MNATEKPAKPRQRSPAYPYFTLKDCISYIHTIRDAVGYSMVPVGLALAKLGFKPTSSTARRAQSSLINYGLLDHEGTMDKKRVQLSELSRRILVDTRKSSPEKISAYQTAALTDKMMKEVWEHWKYTLPVSEEDLASQLRLEWDFTERAAKRFSSVIIDNYRFAHLDEYYEPLDTEAEGQDMTHEQQRPIVQPSIPDTQTRPKYSLMDYAFPLRAGALHVYLRAPSGLTDGEFETVVKMIQAIKPGLVKIKEDENDDE